MSIRKKHKPDTAQLNFVSTNKDSTNAVRISKVKVPLLSSPATSGSTLDLNDTIPETIDADFETTQAYHEPGHTINRSYQDREKKLAEAWASVRDDIFTSVVELASYSRQLCHLCGDNATVMCCQCGPYMLYCKTCAGEMHMEVNLFHQLLLWQVQLPLYLVCYMCCTYVTLSLHTSDLRSSLGYISYVRIPGLTHKGYKVL